MAVFTFEEDMLTSLLRAVCALRMRVRRSAIGSVMLIRRASPARLGHARDLAAVHDLADLHARETELAVHATGATRDRAALAPTRRAGVTRLLLQFGLRSKLLFRGAARAADDFLQLRALRRVLLHDPRATLLALDHARLGHTVCISCCTSGNLFPEREVESFEQRATLLVVRCRRRDGDIHAPDRVDLVVLDLGENNLFLDTEAVVAATIEGTRRHATEVADAGHRDADQAIQ